MIAPVPGQIAYLLLSRDVAHIYGLSYSFVPEVSTVKHAHIICYMLQFPSTFIKLCHACGELKSNAKCSSFGVYFIVVKKIRMSAI